VLLAGLVGLWVSGATGTRFLHYETPHDFSGFLDQGLGFVIPATLVAFGFWLGALGARRNLRRPATTQDEADCPKCGYALRGLIERRGPECGEPFDPGDLTRRP
jgi:hypothetical protein